MTVAQGGTRTHDLANGLPCSNHLSYRVTQQLSGWVWVLKAELQGIQLKRIQIWYVWRERCGVATMKHKTHAGSDFRRAPNLTVRPSPKSKPVRKKEKRGKKYQWLREGLEPTTNSLPCSNQMSYHITRQISGWDRVLKTEIYLKLKVYMPRVYKTAINCSS